MTFSDTPSSMKFSTNFQFLFQSRDIFFSQMDNLMKELGYCCGSWYTYQPRPIMCNGNGVKKTCEVQIGTNYYR
jgi:hypothetical protein